MLHGRSARHTRLPRLRCWRAEPMRAPALARGIGREGYALPVRFAQRLVAAAACSNYRTLGPPGPVRAAQRCALHGTDGTQEGPAAPRAWHARRLGQDAHAASERSGWPSDSKCTRS
jgi:hypothetical protein